jgi:uncharacterized protein YprB with RNaseH-like and TPR domain
VGYFSDQALRIHQLFIDDFPGERLFLERLIELFSLRPNIVSFNGASFDLRFCGPAAFSTAWRFPTIFISMRCISAVGFGRKPLALLASVPGGIHLGAPRQDDVPGFLIPRLWLDFIKAGTRTGESLSLMERVVEHNSLDVRSLARLFLCLGTFILNARPSLAGTPGRSCGFGQDVFVLG